MTVRVYLAAAFPRRQEVNGYARELRRSNIDVVSSWHSDPADLTPEHELTHAQRDALAQRDEDDLNQASVVVLYGDPPGAYAGSGGKFVEFGMARMLGLRLLVVAHRESIYTCHRDVIFCETPDAAHAYLRGLSVDGRGRVAA